MSRENSSLRKNVRTKEWQYTSHNTILVHAETHTSVYHFDLK